MKSCCSSNAVHRVEPKPPDFRWAEALECSYIGTRRCNGSMTLNSHSTRTRRRDLSCESSGRNSNVVRNVPSTTAVSKLWGVLNLVARPQKPTNGSVIKSCLMRPATSIPPLAKSVVISSLETVSTAPTVIRGTSCRTTRMQTSKNPTPRIAFAI